MIEERYIQTLRDIQEIELAIATLTQQHPEMVASIHCLNTRLDELTAVYIEERAAYLYDKAVEDRENPACRHTILTKYYVNNMAEDLEAKKAIPAEKMDDWAVYLRGLIPGAERDLKAHQRALAMLAKDFPTCSYWS